MRRIVILYLVDERNEKGESIKRGIWANEGKFSVKSNDIQIYDANTGDRMEGVSEVRFVINGPQGLSGKIKSLILTKNPKSGEDMTLENGQVVKSPALIPILDNRGNMAYTEEECLVVEMGPVNDTLIQKLREIKDRPIQQANNIKEKMEEASRMSDLTKIEDATFEEIKQEEKK
jgi:hypothetical protein